MDSNQSVVLVLCLLFSGMCAIISAGIAAFVLLLRRRGHSGSVE